jgi:hypothetical protein
VFNLEGSKVPKSPEVKKGDARPSEGGRNQGEQDDDDPYPADSVTSFDFIQVRKPPHTTLIRPTKLELPRRVSGRTKFIPSDTSKL